MHLNGFAIAGLVLAFLAVLLAAGLRPAVRPAGAARPVVLEPGEPLDEDDGVIADEVVADDTVADDTSPSREDD